MKQLSILLAMFFLQSGIAQNLVPNPSFEDTLQCPYYVSQLSYSTNWSDVNFTPDYYHACNNNGAVNPGFVGVPYNARGYQPARTGNAYAGIVIYDSNQPDYREAFQAQLTSPLVAGKKYQVGMYVILNEDNAQWALDGGLGIYLSENPINSSQLFTYTPQIINPAGNVLNDSLNWTLISGEYTAVGNEEYITISGFLSDADITLFDRGGSYSFTSYAIEDVYVEYQPTAELAEAKKAHLVLSPNPATNTLTISFPEITNSAELHILNSLGEVLYTKIVSTSSIQVDISEFASGTYFVRYVNRNTASNIRFVK